MNGCLKSDISLSGSLVHLTGEFSHASLYILITFCDIDAVLVVIELHCLELLCESTWRSLDLRKYTFIFSSVWIYMNRATFWYFSDGNKFVIQYTSLHRAENDLILQWVKLSMCKLGTCLMSLNKFSSRGFCYIKGNINFGVISWWAQWFKWFHLIKIYIFIQ